MAKLRWKLDDRETGLRSVLAGPRGSRLHDGAQVYARISHSRSYGGWYWVAGWQSGVPHYNSCSGAPIATADEAKAQAKAYVLENMPTENSL